MNHVYSVFWLMLHPSHTYHCCHGFHTHSTVVSATKTLRDYKSKHREREREREREMEREREREGEIETLCIFTSNFHLKFSSQASARHQRQWIWWSSAKETAPFCLEGAVQLWPGGCGGFNVRERKLRTTTLCSRWTTRPTYTGEYKYMHMYVPLARTPWFF